MIFISTATSSVLTPVVDSVAQKGFNIIETKKFFGNISV